MKPYQWVFCTFSMIFFLFAYGWQSDSFSGTHAENSNTKKVQMVTVQKGDTLYELSKKYGVSVQDMVKENKIMDPTKIQIGQRLRIPTLSTSTKSSTSEQKTNKSSSKIQSKEIKNEQIPSITRGKNLGTFMITAYTDGIDSTGKQNDLNYGVTKSGERIIPGVTVAVDPKVIPIGSRIYIEGVGYRIAQDVGGAAKGNQMNLFFANLQDAKEFGIKRDVRVEILAD